MSDKPPFFFDQFVPGFDFLKNLAGGAAAGGKGAAPGMSAMPGMSNWVAPTLSVEEVDKRIQEMKAVQFWLEQNLHALKATIQALEVQKMTLSTLQGMNLRMEDLAKAFVSGVPAHKAHETHETPEASGPASAPKDESKPAPGIVDPMKLWGALAEQFQQIAKTALSDAAHLKMPGMPAAVSAAAPPKKPTAGKAPASRKARAPAAGKAARKKTQTRT